MAPSYHRHYSLCQASAAKPARSALQLAAEAFTTRSRERFFNLSPRLGLLSPDLSYPSRGARWSSKEERTHGQRFCAPHERKISSPWGQEKLSASDLQAWDLKSHSIIFACIVIFFFFFLSYVFISFPLSQTKHCMIFTDLFLANSKKSVKYLKLS